MMPILAEGFHPAGLAADFSRRGFTQVLNPVAVLAKIFPGAEQADTSLAFMALVFYFVACALLAALLYARARTFLPEAPPAPSETPLAVEPESMS
jgi:hypothetical protein